MSKIGKATFRKLPSHNAKTTRSVWSAATCRSFPIRFQTLQTKTILIREAFGVLRLAAAFLFDSKHYKPNNFNTRSVWSAATCRSFFIESK